jgi:hypothetical protein
VDEVCNHTWKGPEPDRECERCGAKAVKLQIGSMCFESGGGSTELKYPMPACVICPLQELCYTITLQGGFGPWNDHAPWPPVMAIKASTYNTMKLFDVPEVGLDELKPDHSIQSFNPNILQPGQYVDSPQGTWRYFNRSYPAGRFTGTWMLDHRGFAYARRGFAVFDGKISIPTLTSKNYFGKWNKFPFMSLTPGELLAMREGIDRAKGMVVVAGLGLGYALVEISKKEEVEKIILVEISEEQIDWILPKVQEHMNKGKLEEIIVGDAYVEVPKLEANTALIDIFQFHDPGNTDNFLRIKRASKGIKDMWGWSIPPVPAQES